MYNKALVATEGSALSRAALTEAVKLASKSVVVVRVPDSVPMMMAGAGAPSFVDADTVQRLADAELAEVDADLTSAKATLENAGLASVEVVVGRERTGDAIVIATHGSSGPAGTATEGVASAPR
jgi:nucleotide-binding universal stress UspA family protein